MSVPCDTWKKTKSRVLLGTRMLGTTYSGVHEGLVVAFRTRGLPMVLFVKLALAERCSCGGGHWQSIA